MFIVVEGLDASGKNTQAKALADRFTRNGRTANLYSFPRYETPVGEVILRILKGTSRLTFPDEGRDDGEALVLQALMTADKLDAAPKIRRQLRSGEDVICDRWTPSAECYGAADGLPREWIERIQDSLPDAEFYFFIAVSEEEALRRRPKLRDRYEKDRAKLAIVRRNYETMWAAKRQTGFRNAVWTAVDGEGTPDEVTQRIWDAIVEKRNI